MPRRLTYPPRLIRLAEAPAYVAMDKNRFNDEVRPELTEIRIGIQGIAFCRLELDAWVDDYIKCNGRRPKAKHLEDDTCQTKTETKCRGSASKVESGKSRNDANTPQKGGSGRARAHLAELRQKDT